MRFLALFISLFLSGCLLDFPDATESGRYKCNADNDCASGFSCVNQVCVDQNITQTGNDAGGMTTPEDTGVSSVTDSGVTPMDTGMVMNPIDSGTMTVNPDAMTMGDPDAMMMGNPDAMMMGNPDAMMMGNPDAMMMGNPDAMSMMTPDAGMADTGPAPCSAPMVMCGADCVDLQTNADHCGACDDTCLGGLCANRECLPFDYYASSTNDIGVIRLQQDMSGQRNLVWALEGTSGQILMRDPFDSVSFPLQVVSSVRRPQDIAVEQDGIWFSSIEDDTTKAGRVYRRSLPISTQRPVEDITANSGVTSRQVYSVSALSGTVYWYSVMPLRLRSFDYARGTFTDHDPRTGSSFAKFLIATPAAVSHASALLYQSGTVPVLYSRGIDLSDQSVPMSSGQTNVPAVPGLVVQNSTAIFWAEEVSGTNGCAAVGALCNIIKYDLATGQISSAAELPMGLGALGLFVDDTDLYYTSGDTNGRNGDVAMISLAPGTSPGSSSVRISSISGTAELKGIAKVDNFVFWVVNGSSSSKIQAVRIP